MNESDKILFHYTSLEGLIGIIEKRSIWATSILYLNDASEMIYSIGLFREQVIKIKKEAPKNSLYSNALRVRLLESFYDLFLDLIDPQLTVPAGQYTFVSSFSHDNHQ